MSRERIIEILKETYPDCQPQLDNRYEDQVVVWNPDSVNGADERARESAISNRLANAGHLVSSIHDGTKIVLTHCSTKWQQQVCQAAQGSFPGCQPKPDNRYEDQVVVWNPDSVNGADERARESAISNLLVENGNEVLAQTEERNGRSLIRITTVRAPAPPAKAEAGAVEGLAKTDPQIPRNLILQGPPGTGKTHTARRLAAWLIQQRNLPTIQDAIGKIEEIKSNRTEDPNITSLDQFTMVQFHPAASYEDFVRGIRAKTESDASGKKFITYEVEHGHLSEICVEAAKSGNENNNYVLIIDEINRANLPAVLGECIFALEYRGESVDTPYKIDESTELTIPENLWIIGTMNTADRSVGHLDYAIRRRFFFVDCHALDTDNKDAEAKFREVKKIIETHKSEEFEEQDIQIGHTYFMKNDWATKLKYQVVPILKEYVRDGILKPDAKTSIDNLLKP